MKEIISSTAKGVQKWGNKGELLPIAPTVLIIACSVRVLVRQ